MTDILDIIYIPENEREMELPLDNRYMVFMSDEELREYWETEEYEKI